MTWRVAKSLETLLGQLDELAPNRSKASDGGVGDAAHASRTSDHNPWVRDAQGIGVVTARDFTHDPADGCDCNALVHALVASRDPRIKYIIWNRQIINSSNWVWKQYTGANPHTHHAHVSVKSEPGLYDDASPWAFGLPAPDPSAKRAIAWPTVRKGSKGEAVKHLQQLLGIDSDGIFGSKTETAVAAFQAQNSLIPDGVVGAYTWEALGA